MVLFVVHSMFLVVLPSLMLLGTMVLLGLGSTHYNHRGGASLSGINCGVFFIAVDPTASSTSWGYGAALSFKLDRLNLFSYI